MYTIQEVNEVIKHVDANLVSDGYHTFGELYDHRIRLYIQVCKLASKYLDLPVWMSLLHHDGSSYEGWFILGIYKEKGKQISYHLPEKYLGEVAGNSLVEILDNAPEWDGHSSSDVLERLRGIC
jgi:hypothetical protein